MSADEPYDESPWRDKDPWADEGEPDALTYLQWRRPGRTYVSKSFEDGGEPARLVRKVFDSDESTDIEYDGRAWVLRTSPRARSQVTMLIRGQERSVAEITFVRVLYTKAGAKTQDCVHLDGEHAEQLIELIRNLECIPAEGKATVRVDDALVRAVFTNPNAMTELYRKDPERFRQLITDDASARDVVAVAHRREQVERFHRLLEDDAYFDEQVRLTPRHRGEDVWQAFFEENPWILGVSLAGQILTSWSSEKLEQVVAGWSINGVGKRTDALLRTAGMIRSLVFAEFKTHRTPLLAPGKPYRSGCFPPSAQLAGGITQILGTVHLALAQIGERLESSAPDGSEIPGNHSYLIHPRSFLVIGHQSELRGPAGGDHPDRIRSFELFRRNMVEPEVVTYDELLARAEWHVGTAATLPT